MYPKAYPYKAITINTKKGGEKKVMTVVKNSTNLTLEIRGL